MEKEEKMLKEAMKIILRDGSEGRLFEAAKKRYIELSTPERIHNLSHELPGIDWTQRYAEDVAEIEKIIS